MVTGWLQGGYRVVTVLLVVHGWLQDGYSIAGWFLGGYRMVAEW